MTKLVFSALKKLPAGSGRWMALAAATTVLLLAAISCRTVNRAVVVLPHIPGATYIGSRECEMCHDEIYRDFATADHARLLTAGPNALHAGCESCHGPGSLHADLGDESLPPYSFTPGRPRALGQGARVAVLPPRVTENTCYECHAEIRGQFNLPHHHAVPEGRMTCWDCHPPHKGMAHRGGSTALRGRDELCLQCHAAQRGPHVFEHEAMREGCTTCHNPHGSVNPKMLKVRDSNLCLQCHFQEVRVEAGIPRIRIGGFDHTERVRQGTCWTAGCHEAVHGSRVNSSLRF